MPTAAFILKIQHGKLTKTEVHVEPYAYNNKTHYFAGLENINVDTTELTEIIKTQLENYFRKKGM